MTETGRRGPRARSGQGLRGWRGTGGLRQGLGSANRFSGAEWTSWIGVLGLPFPGWVCGG